MNDKAKMKFQPVKPGDLAMIWRTRPGHKSSIGFISKIISSAPHGFPGCYFCGGKISFIFENKSPSGGTGGCPCSLLKISPDEHQFDKEREREKVEA